MMLTVSRGHKKLFKVQHIIVKPKIPLTDEAFDGYCADLASAETMADLSAISKDIREKNFDAAGAEKLTAVYSAETKRVRAIIEQIK